MDQFKREPGFWVWTISLVALTAAEVCKTGYNYPTECPRDSDPPDRIKCCRNGFEPNCCEKRAKLVCAFNNHTQRSEHDWDPPTDYYAIWCPGPSDSVEHRTCSFGDGTVECVEEGLSTGDILIIVALAVGSPLLGSLCIICICGCCTCCLIKRGSLVNYKYRDSAGKQRRRIITRQTHQQYLQQERSQAQPNQVAPSPQYGVAHSDYGAMKT